MSMENAVLQEILEKPFEQFMQERSSEVRDNMFKGPSHVFLDCPEDDYDAVFGALNTKGGIHLAVSGSVEPAMGQITEINPDLSLLLDINQSAMSYLRLRMALLEAADSPEDYWRRFDAIFDNEDEIDARCLIEKAGCEIPRYLVRDALALANMNIRASETMMMARRTACESGEQLPLRIEGTPVANYATANPTPRNRRWTDGERFYKAKKAWTEGRIKGTVNDFTSGGINVALDTADKTGLQIKVIYVSNISAYTDGKQLRSMCTLFRKGLDTGAIEPHCKMIDWSGWTTRISSVRDYVETRERYLH